MDNSTNAAAQGQQTAIRLTITNTLPNDGWGWDDLLDCLGPEATPDDQRAAILELIAEDTLEALEGGAWQVEIVRGDQAQTLPAQPQVVWQPAPPVGQATPPDLFRHVVYWVALADGTTTVGLPAINFNAQGQGTLVGFKVVPDMQFVHYQAVTHYAHMAMPATPEGVTSGRA